MYMGALTERRGLRCRYYPAYGDIPNLGHLNVYIQWWRKIVRRDHVPTRKDIAFTDLRGLHSRITLCQVLEDRSGMVARIVGEDVKALFRNYLPEDDPGHEAGVHLRELVQMDRLQQDAHVRLVADGSNIGISSGTLALATRRTLDISALDFPLAPEPGETPHILTIYDFEMEFQDRNVPHYGLIAI